MSQKFIKNYMIWTLFLSMSGCRSGIMASDVYSGSVHLPFLKNTGNECYYLDEFMPTPDSMTTGRNGSLSLRYYSYKSATYKEWQNTRINLSFYSNDKRCWSLFEEFYTAN